MHSSPTGLGAHGLSMGHSPRRPPPQVVPDNRAQVSLRCLTPAFEAVSVLSLDQVQRGGMWLHWTRHLATARTDPEAGGLGAQAPAPGASVQARSSLATRAPAPQLLEKCEVEESARDDIVAAGVGARFQIEVYSSQPEPGADRGPALPVHASAMLLLCDDRASFLPVLNRACRFWGRGEGRGGGGSRGTGILESEGMA